MTAPDHDRFADLAGLYAIGALAPAERDNFGAHLQECEICAAEVASYRPVAEGLARAVPLREPAPDLRARVLASVGAPSGRMAPVKQPIDRVRGSRSTLAWLVAAAAFLLAVGTTWYAAGLRQRVEALEAGLRAATARDDQVEREAAGLRQVATDAQSTIAILAAPDLARIELAGQVVAPRARARAFWSRSRGLVVTASDLPAPPPGKTYQLWVVTREAAISAGFLDPDSSGRATTIAKTPPDLPTPIAMAVTIEPAGGVPAPTGERYLVGTPALL